MHATYAGTSFFTALCIALSFIFACPSSLAAPSAVSKNPARNHFIFYVGFQSPAKEILAARLTEAFRRNGLTFELISTSSSERALQQANTAGDGDACRVLNIKDIAPTETTNLIQIPEAVITMRLAVYTKNREFPVTGWEALKDYHTGARLGAKIIEIKLPPEKRTFVPTTEQLFQMLRAERIDAVVEWDLLAQRSIDDLGMTEAKQLSLPLATKDFFPYIHKKYQDLVPRLAAALAEMKKDGTFVNLEDEVLKNIVHE